MPPGAAGRALGPQPREYLLARDQCHLTAFQIVVAPIQRLPRECKFVKKIDHHVLHQLVTRAPCVSRHLLKLRLYFWGKVHFHRLHSFSEKTCYAAATAPASSLRRRRAL